MTVRRVGTPGAPRPSRPPRLVALDLDGTCLDLHQRLHPRTRDAVRRVVAGGTVVVVATGRMFRSALPWAAELRTTTPLICYQGAVVRALPAEGAPLRDGVPQGELLFEDPVPADVALAALRLARRGGWHRQAYRDDRLLCEEDRPEAHLYARIAQVQIDFVDDLEPLLAGGTTKVVCVVDDAAGAQACQDALTAGLDGRARVTRSLPPFVEVTNPVASKGRALRRLCQRMGWSLDDSLAVGDAPNDGDMLDACTYAVAVEGAPEEVVARADALCAAPEDGGVADVLEALLPG